MQNNPSAGPVIKKKKLEDSKKRINFTGQNEIYRETKIKT
jgi:hypothetical protein